MHDEHLDGTHRADEEHSVPQNEGAPPAQAAARSEPTTLELDLASVENFKQAKIDTLLETIDTLEFYSLDSHFSALSRRALPIRIMVRIGYTDCSW